MFAKPRWNVNDFKLLSQCTDMSKLPGRLVGKAWDAEVWSRYYQEADRKAKSKHPATMWRDPTIAGFRMLVSRSTQDYLTSKKVQQVRDHGDGIETITLPTELTRGMIRRDTIDILGREPKYKHTEVRVLNMDCLELAYQVQEAFPGKRVACINMANINKPGGGWKNGKCAQEEMLFMRTALSTELTRTAYPLGTYTTILCRDVAVLRGGVDEGFPFYTPSKVWRTNIVTVTGFDLNARGPNKKPQPFTDEVALKTRAKIESMFSLCANAHMDILVLSALGCGAFRNPPEHVAAIFRAVIEQYAGYFSHIYFGIMGPYNSLNLIAFARTLVSMTINAIPQSNDIHEADPIFYSYERQSPSIPAPTDVSVPPCQSGGLCTNEAPGHFSKFTHPPPCPFGPECARKDRMHRLMFFHYAPPPALADPESSQQPAHSPLIEGAVPVSGGGGGGSGSVQYQSLGLSTTADGQSISSSFGVSAFYHPNEDALGNVNGVGENASDVNAVNPTAETIIIPVPSSLTGSMQMHVSSSSSSGGVGVIGSGSGSGSGSAGTITIPPSLTSTEKRQELPYDPSQDPFLFSAGSSSTNGSGVPMLSPREKGHSSVIYKSATPSHIPRMSRAYNISTPPDASTGGYSSPQQQHQQQQIFIPGPAPGLSQPYSIPNSTSSLQCTAGSVPPRLASRGYESQQPQQQPQQQQQVHPPVPTIVVPPPSHTENIYHLPAVPTSITPITPSVVPTFSVPPPTTLTPPPPPSTTTTTAAAAAAAVAPMETLTPAQAAQKEANGRRYCVEDTLSTTKARLYNGEWKGDLSQQDTSLQGTMSTIFGGDVGARYAKILAEYEDELDRARGCKEIPPFMGTALSLVAKDSSLLPRINELAIMPTPDPHVTVFVRALSAALSGLPQLDGDPVYCFATGRSGVFELCKKGARVCFNGFIRASIGLGTMNSKTDPILREDSVTLKIVTSSGYRLLSFSEIPNEAIIPPGLIYLVKTVNIESNWILLEEI